jgi:predicted ATPase
MNNLAHIKRFIFTGTPSSGKSSVIMELEKLGHAVIHEAATNVISKEQAKGVESPWEEPEFIDQITHMQKELQMKATGDLQFYDRSPFCAYALGKYLSNWKNVEFKPSLVLLDEIDHCLKNNVYQNKVFFFKNLGFIEHTEARKISYEEALIFEQINLNVYKKFGFEMIVVPKGLTITQRCNFILERVL